MICEESRGFDPFVYKHYTANKVLKLSFCNVFLLLYMPTFAHDLELVFFWDK